MIEGISEVVTSFEDGRQPDTCDEGNANNMFQHVPRSLSTQESKENENVAKISHHAPNKVKIQLESSGKWSDPVFKLYLSLIHI